MRNAALAVVVCVVAAAAGCSAVGDPASAPDEDETVTVGYVVGGETPEELRSVTVTLRVVFVEDGDDFETGACWRDTYRGPYKPTPTPVPQPDGDCHRSETVTVDLADLDGERSLGTFSAPAEFDAGHALVVTDVTATDRDGTTADGIKGVGGVRAHVTDVSDGEYTVQVEIRGYDDRPYHYWLVTDPATDG